MAKNNKRYYDASQSKAEGEMISGPLGIALMPENVIRKYYPKGDSFMTEGLNDGMSGIAAQKSADSSKAKATKSKSKY
jgi:hypothetical protein